MKETVFSGICKTDSPLAQGDAINAPSHYTGRGGIEPIDFIATNRLDFLEGCIVKYVYRYPAKNGSEDLRKARRYLDVLIERESKPPLSG